jgi:hypothetical protein
VTGDLTLFGKPAERMSDGLWAWFSDVSTVLIWRNPQRQYSRSCEAFGIKPLDSLRDCIAFETPELARDDAERALRELYAALGEVIEPWKGGQPYEDGSYEVAVEFDDGERYVYVEHWSASGWSGDQFAYSRRDELKRAVYAWRPMPKAPPRKP